MRGEIFQDVFSRDRSGARRKRTEVVGGDAIADARESGFPKRSLARDRA